MKAVTDALVIARIQAYTNQRILPAFFVFVVVMPLAMLFFAANMQEDGAELSSRLLAGSMVFSLGISTVNALTQTIIFERFNHQLQLVIISPVNRLSYALGLLLFGACRGALGIMVLVLVAPLLGFDIQLSIWLLPIALLTALSMAGIALVIGTWSPDQNTGNLLAQVAGILVVMMSPIYFSLSRLPEWLHWPARLSPYTHASEAFQSSFNGAASLLEVGILAAITVVTMTIGIAGMRWRDV